MELDKRERFVIELFLGMIFIVFLVIMIFLFVGVLKANSSNYAKTPMAVTNSYHIYYGNGGQTTKSMEQKNSDDVIYTTPKTYFMISERSQGFQNQNMSYRMMNYRMIDSRNDYYLEKNVNSRETVSERNLYFNDYSQLREVEGVLGNRVNNYEVYVANEDYNGGYFKVTFYFEDYNGNVDDESVTQYIDPQGEKRFFYKDVSPSDYKVENWWYSVEPMTQTKSQNLASTMSTSNHQRARVYYYDAPVNVYYYS